MEAFDEAIQFVPAVAEPTGEPDEPPSPEGPGTYAVPANKTDKDEDGLSLLNLCVEYFLRRLIDLGGGKEVADPEGLAEGLAASLDHAPSHLQQLIYSRGFKLLHDPSSAYFQTEAKQKRLYKSWRRIACCQGSRLPRVEKVELPDFTGNHWSRLASEQLVSAWKESRSAGAVRTLSLSSHPKNGSGDVDVVWKWRLSGMVALSDRLETLTLTDCVDDDVLAAVGRSCPATLRRLVLAGVGDVSDEGIEEFVELLSSPPPGGEKRTSSLEELDMGMLLTSRNFTMEGVVHLSKLETLRRLKIESNMVTNARLLGDQGLVNSSSSKQHLEELHLSFHRFAQFPSFLEDMDFVFNHFDALFRSVTTVILREFPARLWKKIHNDCPIRRLVRRCWLRVGSEPEGAFEIFPSMDGAVLDGLGAMSELLRAPTDRLVSLTLLADGSALPLDTAIQALRRCRNLKTLLAIGEPVRDQEREGGEGTLVDWLEKRKNVALEHFEVVSVGRKAPLGARTVEALARFCPRLQKAGRLETWSAWKLKKAEGVLEEQGFSETKECNELWSAAWPLTYVDHVLCQL